MTAAASFVVPARNEEAYLPATLRSLRGQETEVTYDVVVVDGASDDATRAVAERHGADVVVGDGRSIAAGRNRGAERATGEWLAFVDADTRVAPGYLDAMLGFVRTGGLVAATSRCRMPGVVRAKAMETTINRVFPRLDAPILPGFNCFVRRDVFERVGGFPDVPNEDTAFSRVVARHGDTGYHPDALVETSPRRIARSGLTGTLYHYLRLDWDRLRAAY